MLLPLGPLGRVLLLLLVALAAFVLFAWLVAERVIFQPPRAGYAESAEFHRVATADGGRVAAVHLPNPRARHTVLFSHGNAEDLGHNRDFLEEMRRAGFAVYAYDYRGYGLSGPGPPSERRAYLDADAAYDHLTGALGVPPERVILHGRSLGGAVAAELASRRPCAGLVLESTFVSAYQVLGRAWRMPLDRFRTARRLPRVDCPVLVIHGTDDEVIGAWHGARLFALAPEPKQAFWVEGAGHNDLAYVAGEAYWRTLREWAEGIGTGEPPHRPDPDAPS
jgi:abhydrolase domain-containing protein 17